MIRTRHHIPITEFTTNAELAEVAAEQAKSQAAKDFWEAQNQQSLTPKQVFAECYTCLRSERYMAQMQANEGPHGRNY